MEGPHDFNEIWRADGPTLWRAVYAFTGGRRDVTDDAVAEAFARAMARGGKVRDPLAYLFRIAFRVAGTPLGSSTELQRRMFEDAIGRRVEITVWRNGALVDVIAVPRELTESAS